MGVLLIYSTMFVPFSMAFLDQELDELQPILIVNVLLDIFFMIDFAMGFVSAYHIRDGTSVETRHRMIMKQQLTSPWVIIDLLACFPSELVLAA